MFCPKCGKAVKDGYEFCMGCGTKIDRSDFKLTEEVAYPVTSSATASVAMLKNCLTRRLLLLLEVL